ncbi:GDSL-type esterase/lipase family protein [Streptomyces sp. NPDC051940]|uniref:GDSL-type esterase/lipase family protein n=1 Tax=Streptomyces sp. NPDC051940 TaxID=3155675 RepID=UPI00343B1860
MRIMFVGDSMTIGGAGEHTWRFRMWQHLDRTHDGPFTVVGPRDGLYDPATGGCDAQSYADPGFPRAHLAGWGEGWLHMAPLIGPAVREHRADTLLVSLGLIDLGFYTNAGQTLDNVHRFVAAARGAEPHVRIVVLPVLSNVKAVDDPPFGAECERFNELLAKAVAELSTPASPLLLASPPDPWDLAAATHDGTHPSLAGEHQLAAAFADALHQGWGVGGRYRLT